ncbi:superoxide dismutase [Phenylobacterium sp. J367]|uniref:superoxide dismutase n=1 Tax=Phenylobacterium sp. J367 TaxID=2898435 RepID=UPI002150A096|nr:superoxide dismutase [Phenylobacterium sp. J367]MCR5878538.1 superoxide dismutase [Phenylobacterium sp. J367]
MIKLPPLPYPYEALEPTISATTMRTHHDKHHAKYVETTNTLAKEKGLDGKSLEEIIAAAEKAGEKKLFNNAAQAWNHAFFWTCMTPERQEPTAELMALIGEAFGGLAGLKEKFVQVGADHFASGWVWLAVEDGKLTVVDTHDGGTLAHKAPTPLLVCDVWEHAYYLDYKQDRKAFLEKWFDTVANWEFAAHQLAAAQGREEAWRFAEAA